MRRSRSSIHRAFVISTLLGCLLVLSRCSTEAPSELYPPIEPSRSGYLKVSDLHELYWEVVGNPEGLPVIVLHGGPGGSASPTLRSFFDPERFFVLLFDQRGAHRSRPRGEWRENTTHLLIEDINTLRDHVGIEGKAILFGGSWGSTLALAYAERYPNLVSGMVLRGIFLGTNREIDYFYHGGTALFFPDNWERLRGVVPDPETLNYPRQLFEMMTSGDENERETAIEGWAYYEARMSSIFLTDEATDDLLLEYADHLMPFAVLENHYMMNDCFLAEGQLLAEARRIRHIPTYIVHGRFDMVTLPHTAWELAQRLDRVQLDFTAAAGHSQSEPANRRALLRGIEWVAEQVELDAKDPAARLPES